MPHGPCGAFSFSLAVPLFLLHSFVFFFFFALLFYSSSIFFSIPCFSSLCPFPFLEKRAWKDWWEMRRWKCWENLARWDVGKSEREGRGDGRGDCCSQESQWYWQEIFFFIFYIYKSTHSFFCLEVSVVFFVCWKLGEKSFLLDPLVRASSPNLFGCFLKVPWIYFLGI